MSRIPVQMARMSAADLANYAGPPGEQVWNTDTKRTHFQDGVTKNGWPTRLLVDLLAGEVRYDALQALTVAQQVQALANIGALGAVDGACRLSVPAADTLLLSPREGNKLLMGSAIGTIPEVGVQLKIGAAAPASQASVLNGQAPTANTTMWVYAFSDGAGGATLELSSRPRAVGTLGMQIKSGDASRRLVGMVRVGSGAFIALLNWFDKKEQWNTFDTGQVTVSSSSYTTILTGNFLTWGDQPIQLGIEGTISSGAAGQGIFERLSLDSQTSGTLLGMGRDVNNYITTSGGFNTVSKLYPVTAIEGWRTLTLAAQIGSGSSAIISQLITAKTRG